LGLNRIILNNKGREMQRSANSQIGTSQFGDEEGWAEMVWACE